MTNTLVGDIYAKVLEGVIDKSRIAFEEFGVPVGTLEDLETSWKTRLTQRAVAQMPWDPKPEPIHHPAANPAPPSTISNGLTQPSYSEYDNQPANGAQIKPEYGGLPSYSQSGGVEPAGGATRAAQLMQQNFGTAASASVNAMQRGTGLALPGQQQQSKPQGLQLPAGSTPSSQHQYSLQQQQAMRQHQQQLQQQQAQPRIKVESNESPRLGQGSFPQQAAQPNYSQTDGADDGLDEWKTMLAQRRAMHAEHGQHADRLMREHILQHSAELQSGLMMPLDELPSNKRLKRTATSNNHPTTSSGPSISQLDGLADEDEDDEKPKIDSDEINSDLDDSDDEGGGQLGDDDDENVDSILCTYDKVQRVKNKWKCTLKDGIMSANGKEWIFAKGMGEFEW